MLLFSGSQKILSYLPPEALDSELLLGQRVWAPLRHRLVLGVVVARGRSDCPVEKLKKIHACLDPLPPRLWDLLCWTSRFYFAPLSEVLRYALPLSVREGKALPACVDHWQRAPSMKPPRSCAQQRVWSLLAQGSMASTALEALGIRQKSLEAMVRGGYITPMTENSPIGGALEAQVERLTRWQATAYSKMTSSWEIPYLLQMASGKSALYAALALHCLHQGQSCLILVPEVARASALRDRLGSSLPWPIAVMTSTLCPSQRAGLWARVQTSAPQLVIGTRCALFLPFFSLGLLIVDEEQEDHYKQQGRFRYHGREVAKVVAQRYEARLLLASATPSLESLYQAQLGLLHLLHQPSPPRLCELITLQHLTHGVSQVILDRISMHVEAASQVLIVIPRRGFAARALCRRCGHPAQCADCGRAYSVHPQSLRCHPCRQRRAVGLPCVRCGCRWWRAVGVGTQQLADFLKKRFPHVPLFRLDGDNSPAQNRQQHASSKRHAPSLVVSTSMVWGLPQLRLVALLQSDAPFFSMSVRAAERWAQWLTQVSGLPGVDVLLQTDQPEHPLFQSLRRGYSACMEMLLEQRLRFSLFPAIQRVIITCEAAEASVSERTLTHLADTLRGQLNGITILGPVPHLYPQKAHLYRAQLLLTHPDLNILVDQLTSCWSQIDPPPGCWVDVHPVAE